MKIFNIAIHFMDFSNSCMKKVYLYMYSYNQYQLTLSHTHKIQESSVIAIQTGRKFSWAIQLNYRILVSFLAHMLEVLQLFPISSVQSRPTLCDPMNCSTPGLPVHHQLLFTQTHVHRVGDAIQPSHPPPSPFPPAPNPSQHQNTFR